MFGILLLVDLFGKKMYRTPGYSASCQVPFTGAIQMREEGVEPSTSGFQLDVLPTDPRQLSGRYPTYSPALSPIEATHTSSW